jgi:hypothetical protein
MAVSVPFWYALNIPPPDALLLSIIILVLHGSYNGRKSMDISMGNKRPY